MKYLLCGGSNCLIKNGFGIRLQETMQGVWVNKSLGATSSIRGVDYLISNNSSLIAFDRIFFEYTLNDMIFENILNPITHLHVLTSLCQNVDCNKLCFLLLCGRTGLNNYRLNRSMIRNNYIHICKSFNIDYIDLMPVIDEMEQKRGNIYIDGNDHFDKQAVHTLVSSVCKHIHNLKHKTRNDIRHIKRYNLFKINIQDKKIDKSTLCEKIFFNTSLINENLYKLHSDSSLSFLSPGGAFLGFYAIKCQDGGAVSIQINNICIIKVLSFLRINKPFLVFVHFSQPIYTREGERIEIRRINTLYDIPNSSVDHQLGENLFFEGGFPAIGSMVFLQDHTLKMKNSILDCMHLFFHNIKRLLR